MQTKQVRIIFSPIAMVCKSHEAHRLSQHEDDILVDDLARRGKEEPGGGDVKERDGANDRVRGDDTHLASSSMVAFGEYVAFSEQDSRP